MSPRINLKMSEEGVKEILDLSAALGFPPEMAVEYAVRLVNACIREGLLTDTPSRAWPAEADRESLRGAEAGGKVIDFPGADQKTAQP